jgi:hypothetical protein
VRNHGVALQTWDDRFRGTIRHLHTQHSTRLQSHASREAACTPSPYPVRRSANDLYLIAAGTFKHFSNGAVGIHRHDVVGGELVTMSSKK